MKLIRDVIIIILFQNLFTDVSMGKMLRNNPHNLDKALHIIRMQWLKVNSQNVTSQWNAQKIFNDYIYDYLLNLF